MKNTLILIQLVIIQLFAIRSQGQQIFLDSTESARIRKAGIKSCSVQRSSKKYPWSRRLPSSLFSISNYDQYGRITGKTYYNPDGKMNSTSKWKYDDQNGIILFLSKYSDTAWWCDSGITRFSGNKITSSEFYRYDTLCSSENYFYDEKGLLLAYKRHDRDFYRREFRKYWYNDRGQIIKITSEYQSDAQLLIDTVRYVWKKKKRIGHSSSHSRHIFKIRRNGVAKRSKIRGKTNVFRITRSREKFNREGDPVVSIYRHGFFVKSKRRLKYNTDGLYVRIADRNLRNAVVKTRTPYKRCEYYLYTK